MARIIIFLIASFIIACPAYGEITAQKFDSAKIEFLEIRNSSGHVAIIGTNEKESTVKSEKIKMDAECRMTVELREKTLFVEVKNESWINKGECRINFDITVPRKVEIDLKSGSGKTEISNTEGKIRFFSGSGDMKIRSSISELDGKLGSGNIKAVGTIGNFDLRSGSGEIFLEGLTGVGDIQNGSGDITLRYNQITAGGEVRIRSGSGNSVIMLPADAKIAADFSAGSGNLVNEFGESPKPNFRIAFKAGSGDLQIKKLK